MNSEILIVLMRLLHIASAIVLLGGLVFCVFCLMPCVGGNPSQEIQDFLAKCRKKFSRLQHPAIAGLIVSGLFQWMRHGATYHKMGALGNALIGTKALLAMIVFGLIFSAQAGLIKKSRTTTLVALILGLLVVAIAAYLKQWPSIHS